MDQSEAIQIAKSKKSSTSQLEKLLGIDDEIDLLLAKHPNTSTAMLNDILKRSYSKEKISRSAMAHPNIDVVYLLSRGDEYPWSMFRNSALPAVMQSQKNFLGRFRGEKFENAFELKSLPDVVVNWLLSHGREEFQLIFVSTPKRSPEILAKFRESRHPKVVATLLDKDVNSYLAWAKDLGFDSPAIDEIAPSEIRSRIDVWVASKNQELPAGAVTSKEGIALLNEALLSALKSIENLYFKNGRVAFEKRPQFYDDFVHLLRDTVNADATFTQLVVKVMRFDLSEIERFGHPGRKFPPDIAKSGYYVKSGLEKSFDRLVRVLASWSGKQPVARSIALGDALAKLISDHPVPIVIERGAISPSLLLKIPSELFDDAGEFHASNLFANPRLPAVLKRDPNFLEIFSVEQLEKALRSRRIPEFVLDWLASHGKKEHQTIFLFGAKRSPATMAKFQNSRYKDVVARLLDRDDGIYLSWATDIGFSRPAPNDDFPTTLRWDIDDWVNTLWNHNFALWDQLVPKQGKAPTPQGELVRALGRIQGEYNKNGMMNWGDGSRFYENFTKLIHATLKAEKSFSRLVKKIIDADIAEIKRSGQRGLDIGAGKLSRSAVFGGNIFVQGNVEKSHERLGALITLWCERHPPDLASCLTA